MIIARLKDLFGMLKNSPKDALDKLPNTSGEPDISDSDAIVDLDGRDIFDRGWKQSSSESKNGS